MRLTTIVINDILLPILLCLFFLCVRVHVCEASFSARRAKGERRCPGQQSQFVALAAEQPATALSAATCPHPPSGRGGTTAEQRQICELGRGFIECAKCTLKQLPPVHFAWFP
jgi:hypothetical protein